MTLSVEESRITIETLRTRLPFSFGSTTLRAMPHLFVELTVTVDGNEYIGIAADHAVPKWFRKDPETTAEDDVAAIIEAVEHACEAATQISAETAFDFWRQLSAEQRSWGRDRGLPPLLSTFGTTFVERALIETVCRNNGQAFPEAVRRNAFGIDPAAVYPETEGMEPADAIPDRPRRSIAVRHTIGKTDPLTEDDLVDRLDDGLPETLEGYVERDGVRYVKCKLGGDPVDDLLRLERIAGVLDAFGEDYRVTVDANEQYQTIDSLQDLWTEMVERPTLGRLVDNLLCIEQPFDRDLALTPEAGEMLENWNGPPIIIDESDAAIDTLGTALDLGYNGASVKSCKGVFKSLVNACLITTRRSDGERLPLLTGEDLSTIGPVSLQADLVLMATLGFKHVERNGHHYFRGLETMPADLQEQLLGRHDDLYRRHPARFPTLDIRDGYLNCDSVLSAPYGHAVDVDLSRFTPLEDWSTDSLSNGN